MTHAIRPVDFDNLKTMTSEVTDRVARITFNRPDKGNAIVADTPLELSALVEQGLLPQRITAEDKTTIASRGAKADLFAFQQDHVAHATLGKPQGRMQAGKAAADDGDARLHPALLWRKRSVRRGRSAVVGGGR